MNAMMRALPVLVLILVVFAVHPVFAQPMQESACDVEALADQAPAFWWDDGTEASPEDQSLDSSMEEDYARSVALTLSDQPLGYLPGVEETGVTTNEALAETWDDPSAAMELYGEFGRVTGYSAAYATDDLGLMLRGPFARVKSVVSVYETDEGAHQAFAYYVDATTAWTEVPVPRSGDESILQSGIAAGDNFDAILYILTFRNGRTYCQIEAVGLAGATDLDAVLGLGTIMEWRAGESTLDL